MVKVVTESRTKRDCPSFSIVCFSSIPRVLVCDGGDGGGGEREMMSSKANRVG